MLFIPEYVEGVLAYNDPLVYYTTRGYILCLDHLYVLGLTDNKTENIAQALSRSPSA